MEFVITIFVFYMLLAFYCYWSLNLQVGSKSAMLYHVTCLLLQVRIVLWTSSNARFGLNKKLSTWKFYFLKITFLYWRLFIAYPSNIYTCIATRMTSEARRGHAYLIQSCCTCYTCYTRTPVTFVTVFELTLTIFLRICANTYHCNFLSCRSFLRKLPKLVYSRRKLDFIVK